MNGNNAHHPNILTGVMYSMGIRHELNSHANTSVISKHLIEALGYSFPVKMWSGHTPIAYAASVELITNLKKRNIL